MSVSLDTRRDAYIAALRDGDEPNARAIVEQAHAEGVDIGTIYFDIFAPSMIEIGRLWEENQLSIAEEHLATAITERLIGQLSPEFNRQIQRTEIGCVMLGCVAGERHVLGLRMLADLFRAQGWRVVYLGADVPDRDWIDLAVRVNADVIGISAGTLHLAAHTKPLITQLHSAVPATLIMVGGAGFARSPQLWRDVDANLYHDDPFIAVTMATAHRAQQITSSS